MNNETKKTICIIQLTRFGDLLQTCKAAQALKLEHPNIRLLLIARKQFGTPLNFLLAGTFDRIFLLDAKDIFAKEQIESQICNLNSFLSEVNQEQISVSVNLSFSKTSSYLSSLINADHKLGPHYDLQTNLIIQDRWSQFVYSSVMRGPLAPFNLVDVFKLILGCRGKVQQTQVPQKENAIIVHPFASLPKKHWKIHKWGDIFYKLLRENPSLKIHLVGNTSEQSDAEALVNNPILKNYRSKIINHVGKTEIHELIEIIKKCRLFIGHDSMVGHLASFYNLPILTIPLGCVRPIETTPYGENSFVLAPKSKCFPCFPDTKCTHQQCHADIPYQVIYSCAQQLLDSGKITKEQLTADNSQFNLTSTNIWRASFSSAELFALSDLTGDDLSFKELIKVFYRIAWLYLLSETEEETNFPTITPSLHQQLLTHMPGLQHLYELAEFGKKYCRFILDEISSDSPNVNKIKEFSLKIDDIDKLMESLKNNFPALGPIVDFYAITKGNTAGNNIVELTQHSFLNYNEIASLISIMYDLIEKSLRKYKTEQSVQNHRSV